jgi:hypothetical protein
LSTSLPSQFPVCGIHAVCSGALITTKPQLRYVEGGNLHDTMKKFGKFPESLLVIYITQVLRGLEYLHKQGVIHRSPLPTRTTPTAHALTTRPVQGHQGSQHPTDKRGHLQAGRFRQLLVRGCATKGGTGRHALLEYVSPFTYVTQPMAHIWF